MKPANENSKPANSRQVGGTHYKTQLEHWDWVESQGMGYLEGNATKYIIRWRKKDGIKDLHKALHYIEKLIEVASNTPRRNRCSHIEISTVEWFYMTNEVTGLEQDICSLLLSWRQIRQLEEAKLLTQKLIDTEGKVTDVGT